MEYKQHAATAAAATETEERRLANCNGLLFDVRRSIRYHSKRANFLDGLAKFISVLSILAGLSIVATAIGKYESFYLACGISIAALSLISLIFDLPSKVRLHVYLKNRWIELEKSLVICENPTVETLIEKTNERLSIEKDEPEPVRTLDMMCHNEMVRSQGYGRLAKINWFRSLFCQIDLPLLKPELEAHGIE